MHIKVELLPLSHAQLLLQPQYMTQTERDTFTFSCNVNGRRWYIKYGMLFDAPSILHDAKFVSVGFPSNESPDFHKSLVYQFKDDETRKTFVEELLIACREYARWVEGKGTVDAVPPMIVGEKLVISA